MSGFKFPPPPPPPPSQTAAPHQQAYTNDTSSQGRGRGRGRGNPYDNGRGNFVSRGGFVRGRSRGTGANAQNSYGRPAPLINSDEASQAAPPNSTTVSHANIPPGSYVNPAFNFAQRVHPPHSNVPSTIQSSQRLPMLRNEAVSSNPSSPPRTQAGHKRKLDVLRGSYENVKPGPPAPPSVPTFGMPLLQPQATASRRHPSHPRQSEPGTRTANPLGLTPGDNDQQYSNSEDEGEDDENADEEAMHAELGTKLTFEHNGIVMSLNSPADLIQWRKERIKNFPTKDRMIARLEEKRKLGQERKSLLVEAAEALRPSRDPTRQSRGHSTQHAAPDSSLQKQKSSSREQKSDSGATQGDMGTEKATEALALQMATIDKSSQEQRADQKTANEFAHSADGVVEVGKSEEASTVADAPEGSEERDLSISNHEDSDAESQGNSASDTDSAPEEISAKPVLSERNSLKPICRYFSSRGRCRDGEQCAYSHEVPLGSSQPKQPEKQQPRFDQARPLKAPSSDYKGRKGIHQALIEQEENSQNRLALQVIKYLGKAGFFAAER